MKNDTQTVSIQAPAHDAFAFLSKPTNLPRWAAAFARAIEPDGDDWLVRSPQGDMKVKYVTQSDLGIVDYHLSPGPDVHVVAHSRVIPAQDGCVYVFTQEQAPGMPDDVFAGQIDALARELRLLKSLLEVGSCSP
jgi:hypothetical protein